MVGKFERRKDTVQEMTESAAGHVGRIATIITGAVRDVTHEIGDWISDGIEMRDAAMKAKADEDTDGIVIDAENADAENADADEPPKGSSTSGQG